MIYLRRCFLRRYVHRKFYLRKLGLGSKFFFRKLGLGCSFSFRKVYLQSWLESKSFRRLGLGCRCVLRKFYHRRSCHRKLESKFSFRKLELECNFSFRKVYLRSWLESKSSYRKLGLGCRCVLRKFYHRRFCHRRLGLGCRGRIRLSFVVGCSKYRFPFWLLVLVRMGVAHLFRQFLHQDWRMGFRGRVPRMRTKPKQ